ncbi:MAG: ABC transporter ATP-binding protein [Desulfovibrio sp.]|jgi:ABC-type polysaccharide/polyol phosphate transport system ATPase subunit|nr:ABC transporter ATP-binding protein [Desulfovibrio sp.]
MHEDDTPIIEVRGLWKRYGLPPLLPWSKQSQDDSAYALRDISFSVPRGGSLAILGRNGAGKSTLLKLLAGVTPPDRGNIAVRGSIFPMIELSAGMSMELSGRENAKILGTIMGKLGGELEDLLPGVLGFSELGDWFERPVWQYSSGMLARLAFSIAVNVDADILIVDEVLGVGDIQFQKKCQQAIQRILGRGTALIFVSHSPYQAERLCEQALYMETGSLKMIGTTAVVAKKYLHDAVLSPTLEIGDEGLISEERPGAGDIRITAIKIKDSNNTTVTSLTTGDSYTICLKYHAKEFIEKMNLRIDINDAQGTTIGILGIDPMETKTTILPGDGELRCLIQKFPFYGTFFLSIVLKSTYLLDSLQNAYTFVVEPTDEIRIKSGGKGMALIACTWEGFYEL